MKALVDKLQMLMVNKREPMIADVESGPSLPQRIARIVLRVGYAGWIALLLLFMWQE